MEKLNMHTPDLAEEKYRKLAELFPHAITETVTGYDEQGKPLIRRAVDKDILEREINAHVTEDPEDRYQFTWPDKKKSVLLANAPIARTLRPCREESVGRDGTPGGFDSENLYIEGDNLEVLKLLREAYLARIKMIYIDPPYNTGHDFLYEDDFSQGAAEYLPASGQLDSVGNRLVPHLDGSGRFHTDWLNMMYPRLRFARDLLSEDGVLVMSISDAEFHNLKKMADEIFGDANYCGDILWNSTKSVTNTALLSVSHTYNLIYFKNIRYFVEHRSAFRLPEDGQGFENPDHDPRGPWKADPFQVGGWRPNQQYEIVNPNTGTAYRPNPGCSWKNDYKKFQELLADGRIVFGKAGDGGPQRKRFIWEAEGRGKVAKTWWDDVETTANATQALKKMFDGAVVFDNPKPVGLLEKLVQLGTNGSGIVLDFFSGSGTTAHAVMRLNAQDGGNRRFIMVQIPEPVDEGSQAYKAGFRTISDIGKERIRRAGELVRQEAEASGQNPDLGFRVLKCDDSNMKNVYYRPQETEQALLNELSDNIKEGRTPEDLLFQVMLDLGAPLSSSIEEMDLEGKKAFSVGDGFLIACFDKNVTEKAIVAAARQKPRYFVLRDASLADDSAAMNLEQIFSTYSPTTERRVL